MSSAMTRTASSYIGRIRDHEIISMNRAVISFGLVIAPPTTTEAAPSSKHRLNISGVPTFPSAMTGISISLSKVFRIMIILDAAVFVVYPWSVVDTLSAVLRARRF